MQYSASLTPSARLPDSDRDSRYRSRWRHLSWFFSFRLILSLLLVSTIVFRTGPTLLGNSSPELFSATCLTYLGLVIVSGLLLNWRIPDAEQQSYLMVFTDIVAVTLLMHASGGISSGLGMLLLVSIAGGSLLMEGQAALLFAALASLAIISEQVYAHIDHTFTNTAYTQAGILGASFFAVALLAHVLSLRIRSSEQLATQRGLDLADMAELNEYIIQHMRTGILVVDTEQNIRLLNSSAKELLGAPAITTGQSLAQVCPALPKLLRQWTHQEHRSKPFIFQAIPGGKDVKPGFAQLGPAGEAGTLIFLEDNAVMAQQAQQMKLASLGRLTASIAHEIRNPLGSISHASQLMEESPALEPGDKRLIEIIGNNSERVNQIIENILQLSRRKPPHTRLIELTDWVPEFVQEFKHDNGLDDNNVNIQWQASETRVRADASQLRQIMIILCENSLEHRADADAPLRIEIHCGITEATGETFIEIRDNGPGIAPKVARQMFEPFFTTRNTGTGLGLYIARELSEGNQIRLEYLSGNEHGSRFRISFPDPRRRALMT